MLTQHDTGQHHGLNPVGALIWFCIDGQTFADLVEEVRSQIVEPPPELAEDISDFIEAMQTRQLIDLSEPS